MNRHSLLVLSVLVVGCGTGVVGALPTTQTDVLAVAVPLALSHTTVESGTTLTGSITYLNSTQETQLVTAMSIEAVPPDVAPDLGPVDTLVPVRDQVSVAPGETVTLQSSRTFSDTDSTGTWEAIASFKSNGIRHQGPGVHFVHHGRDAGGSVPTDAGLGTSPPPDAGVTTPPPPDAGVSTGGIVEPVTPGSGDVTFTIRADSDVHAISPLIYGVNQVTDLATTQRGVGLVRAGGNRWTAYNWENNASNAGIDYQNQNDSFLVQTSSAGDAPGEGVRLRATPALASGAAAMVTIPIQGYVAADKLGNGDVNQTSGYLQSRFKQTVARKGSAFSLTPDTTDAFVYQDEFVNWLKTQYPTAFSATAPRILFSLDNEPDLWFDSHPRIQPASVLPAVLIAKNIEFATAVKAVIPTATITGFVSYGYAGFMTLQSTYSGDFTAYYLDQMRLAGTAAGKRLIDVLDLHWYPEATGDGQRITGNSVSAGSVQARVQAPRSLWDPTYTETSWVANSEGAPLRLIPQMKARIAAHYPGTKLAFTEYSYGGATDISGAIAQADVLGIFGREDVYLATFWDLSAPSTMIYAGMRAFTSYDEAGAHFGDTSVRATTSNVASTSVYASIDAARPDRMVIVAINKTGAPLTASITLAAHGTYTGAQVFRLTAASTSLQAAGTVSTTTRNGLLYQLPAYSISVLVPR
jgi:hypothetical protein